MEPIKAYNFRLISTTNEKLDFLAKSAGMSRTQVVSDLICAEYDRMQGNPELAAVMAQMVELKEKMEALMGTSLKG